MKGMSVMLEMYFPENKLEYIPAFMLVLIFVLITVLVINQFIKISKKEEEKALLLEKRLMESKIESHE